MIKKILIATTLLISNSKAHANDATTEPAPKEDVHGIFDVVFKNDYITPRGLLVSNTGLTMQFLLGLSLDLYKDPNQCINKVSLNFGIWNDLWTNQHNPTVGSWNELDWYAGLSFNLNNGVQFSAQFIEFVSPPGNFRPENNAEFTLSYDDSRWKNPVTFNPYVRLFWAISGDSTVVVGKPGGTYYIETGLTPTFELGECPFTVTVSMPTWLSFGPAHFWNGSSLALPNSHCHLGVFSTGLKGTVPLHFIPDRLGHWYLDLGVQYYYLINDNLLQAQLFTLSLSSITQAHHNVGVGYIGLGFNF